MSFIKNVFGNKDDKKTSKKEAKVKIEKQAEIKEKKVEKKVEKVAREVKAPSAPKKDLKRDDVEAYKLLQQPVITEKATELAELNKYVFGVPMSATKSEVLKTVQNVYGVKPLKINMIKVSGKKIRRGRQFGKTKNWKKAIVTLAVGDKIEIYEGV
jgi:large subunit ribosomal protein L23